MKKIKDASELEAAFDAAWDDILFKDKVSKDKSRISYEQIAEHFFLKGVGVAMETGGMKPKRKIVQLIKTDQGWFSLADTGEWFYLVRPLDSECHWVKYPDLPQD